MFIFQPYTYVYNVWLLWALQTPVNVPDHWISFDIVSFGSRLRITKIAISSFGMQFFDGKV